MSILASPLAVACSSVCQGYPHVFSRTVAAVDTKRGYVGMCNGSSAQQESRAALSKNSMFTAGAKNYIQLQERMIKREEEERVTSSIQSCTYGWNIYC